MAGTGPVSGALGLRAWALRLFARGRAGAGAPPPADARAWERFLRAERCALPVRARLGAEEDALAPDARAVLEARATAELKRALSARAQLRALGALAAERGVPALVMKGGVEAAAGGELTDIADVDLLVPPADARPLAAAMEAQGYRPVHRDFPPDVPGAYDLAPRVVPGGIPVEVHFRVPGLGEGADLWEGARPSGVPGLLRPAPERHLWHVLTHAVAHHPERRGLLRELLRVRAALAPCAPEERAWVERRLEGHAAAPYLRAVLAMAAALEAGEVPADPFRATAASAYLLVGLAGRGVPLDGRFGSVLAWATHALASRSGEYGRLWRGAPHSAIVPRGEHSGQWLDRRAPGVAHAVRTGLRSGALLAATPPAWLLARAARRAASEGE